MIETMVIVTILVMSYTRCICSSVPASCASDHLLSHRLLGLICLPLLLSPSL